jgi:hypothetical protein
MFITSIVGWAKSLFEAFAKPQTYGSALEAYIISHDPQNAADVDRLMREFDNNHRFGSFPC